MWKWLTDIIWQVPEEGVKPSAARSSGWSAVRAEQLRTNPTCAVCGSTKNLVAHHIKPYHLYPELELDPKNLITMCEGPAVNCHLLFGHLRIWAWWNPFVGPDAIWWKTKLSLAKSAYQGEKKSGPIDSGAAPG